VIEKSEPRLDLIHELMMLGAVHATLHIEIKIAAAEGTTRKFGKASPCFGQCSPEPFSTLTHIAEIC
jgi:hypothetical protein